MNWFSRYSVKLFSLLIVFHALFVAIYQISDIFTGFGFNESVIYHLFYGIGGFDLSTYAEYFLLFLFLLAILTYYSFKIPNRWLNNSIWLQSGNVILIGLLWYQPLTNNLFTHFGSHFQSRDFVGNIQPVIVESASIKNPVNLIVIYAESFEAAYLNTELFPGVAPNLAKLASQGIRFDNIKPVYGGSSTIAGMVASQCGMPFDYKAIIDKTEPFLPSLTCIGDILSDNDYMLSYLGGANMQFGGKGNFYESHAFDRVAGREILEPQLANSEYTNNWGLYDDSLFEFARNEFKALSKSEDPFGLFLLTLDTHMPESFVSRKCEQLLKLDQETQHIASLQCSDFLISEFIDFVFSQSGSRETWIVLLSDHLSPNHRLIEPKVPLADRRNLFLVLGKNLMTKRIDKLGSPFDISPTLLSLMGGELNELNLGVDLLGPTESLISREEDLTVKLSGWTHQLRKFN